MKKTFFLLFFLIFCSFTFADSITNYTVPNSVPLNKDLTIYGNYSGTPSADVLCSFYIFDVENTDYNQLITRLPDQYTNEKGEFTAKPFIITEPLFRREIDYNAITTCGTSTIGKVFTVSQKEELFFGITAEAVAEDLLFWANPENSMTTVFYFFILLFVAAIFVGLVNTTIVKNLLVR
jgi:hypothetical protein